MYESETDAAAKQKPTSDVVAAAKETAQEFTEPLKEKAREVASEQKDAGAEQLHLLARAMEGACQAVESEVPQFAGYMRDLSGKLDRLSDDVRRQDLDQLGNTMSDFARRNPGLVFGGALLTGLALARFVKSSSPAQQPRYS